MGKHGFYLIGTRDVEFLLFSGRTSKFILSPPDDCGLIFMNKLDAW